jgi:hypothetical protein
MSGRRGFLAGSAATVAASVFAVPPLGSETVAAASPDAELMGWCAALIAMEADWRQRLDVDENANRPAAYYSTLDAITDTPATTIDGNRAKLAAAASFYDPDPPGRSIVDAAMWDAIRALALPTIPVPAVVRDPDADLLTLCADFHQAQAAVMALVGTDEDLDDAMTARYAISDQLIDMVPTTAEGLREMARVALVMTAEEERIFSPDGDVRFALAVVQAAAGVSA